MRWFDGVIAGQTTELPALLLTLLVRQYAAIMHNKYM
jgi:hypothetical protein